MFSKVLKHCWKTWSQFLKTYASETTKYLQNLRCFQFRMFLLLFNADKMDFKFKLSSLIIHSAQRIKGSVFGLCQRKCIHKEQKSKVRVWSITIQNQFKNISIFKIILIKAVTKLFSPHFNNQNILDFDIRLHDFIKIEKTLPLNIAITIISCTPYSWLLLLSRLCQ